MKPTPKLRWVAREYKTVADPNFYGTQPFITRTTNVLQQWWAEYNNWAEIRGEWRDVPVEAETPNVPHNRQADGGTPLDCPS